ncbi:AAA family ATPase [Candidatus Tisiphia endosymbiont of Hybos culiciformis]|uniref:AAA family ATPase n=1 Tax=Candidatus Tisiphia endosymbiont of Hybos culiciformis TaxID=3139331 RepID=UPI003CCA864A
MVVKTPNVITEESKVVQGNKLPRMRVGTDDFKTLLLNSDVFVDKSLMVKELLEDSGDVILIARPRRWGKSLNMNMLQKFFEIEVDERGEVLPLEQKVNYKLFSGGEIDLGIKGKKILEPLKINGNEYAMVQQGNYPVIFISFKDVKGSNYQEIEVGIKDQIIELFASHHYLNHHVTKDTGLLDNAQKEKLRRYFDGKLEKNDFKNSLRFLSEVLYKHFNQKVYILIDEYDTPINSAYLKFGERLKEFEDVLEMFRGMFGSSLKGNPCLEKGVITGILRIAKANLFSDLNNVSEYTLLDKKFAKFYGFTQGEVDELLTKVPLETNPEKIKNWYNGYNFGGEIIYNPWSIMQCLAHAGSLDTYWVDSGGLSLVDKAFIDDDIQEDLQSLLEGKGIVKKLYKQVSLGEIEDNPNIFFSLLLFAGYLSPLLTDDNVESPRYRLTIPNTEVSNIYVERVIKWVTKRLNIKINEYDNFIKLLITQQISQFGEKLQEYLLKSTSYHDMLVERDYHNLMGGILAPLTVQYVIESNRESGYGRCDHMLVPIVGRGDSAIIVEYKICKIPEELESVAKIGLKQIINKQYDAKIKEHVHIKKITKIAIAFCGKEVALEYRVDEL